MPSVERSGLVDLVFTTLQCREGWWCQRFGTEYMDEHQKNAVVADCIDRVRNITDFTKVVSAVEAVIISAEAYRWGENGRLCR